MSSRICIEKRTGKLTEQSRNVFKDWFESLGDGFHIVDSKPSEGRYTPTRYKYYFAEVMTAILSQAGRFYRMVNPGTGEERLPRNTAELHDCMKAIYNPIVLNVEGKSRVIAGTTTDLNDRDFIGTFLEQIIADHSGPPYLVDIMDYDTWKDMASEKAKLSAVKSQLDAEK